MSHSYLNFCHLEGLFRGPVTATYHPRGMGAAFKLEVEETTRVSKTEWSTQIETFEVETGPKQCRYIMHRQDGELLAIDGQIRRRTTELNGAIIQSDYVYGVRIRKLEIEKRISTAGSML